MTTDADIEMWEAAAVAHEADQLTSERDTLLHPATRRRIAEAGASAGWHGNSVFRGILDSIADHGLHLSNRQQSDLLAEAGTILTRWETEEERSTR